MLRTVRSSSILETAHQAKLGRTKRATKDLKAVLEPRDQVAVVHLERLSVVVLTGGTGGEGHQVDHVVEGDIALFRDVHL